MLCYSLLYSKMNQLYVYVYLLFCDTAYMWNLKKMVQMNLFTKQK